MNSGDMKILALKRASFMFLTLLGVIGLPALLALRISMIAFSADKTAELLVDLLIKTNGLYHFDDSPFTIINIENDERTFTDKEAEVL